MNGLSHDNFLMMMTVVDPTKMRLAEEEEVTPRKAGMTNFKD